MTVHNDLSGPVSFEQVYQNFSTQENPNVNFRCTLLPRITFGTTAPQLFLDSDPFFAMTGSGPSSRKIPIPSCIFAISNPSSSQIHKDSDTFCISLHVNSLAELSLSLPTELSAIVQDEGLTESARLTKVKNFLKKYRIDRENLSSLPFYINLWKKPELLKEACAFGIARQRSLHKKMIHRKVEILKYSKLNFWASALTQIVELYETISTRWINVLAPLAIQGDRKALKVASASRFVYLVANGIHRPEDFACLGAVFFSLYNFQKISNFVNSFQYNQDREIDLKSLKKTTNYPAALHYLESFQIYHQMKWIEKIKTFCIPYFKDSASKRLDNLKLNGKKYEIKVAENFGQRFLNLIYRFFSKILALACWPYEKNT